jgi:tetratricopeptide (TPR) repeat protein
VRIILVFFIVLSTSVTAQKKVIKVLMKGDKKLEQSDTTAALLLYSKALSMDTTLADSYAKISDIYVYQSQYEKALNLLNTGLRITMDVPKDPESISHLYSIRSFLYFNLNKYGAALTDLDQAILLNKTNPNYFYMRALIRRMNGDERGCCSDLRKAIALGMESAKVYRENYCN